ncbi:unnamed protein product, partial [Didymodactylos carnosus]
ENGLLAGARKDSIHINIATISPMAAKELAELHKKHGVHYIAGPVLGRPDVAASGKLRTFLGGSKSAVERCRPVVQCYTLEDGIVEVGEDCAHANVLKLSANYTLVTCIDLFGQVYALNEKWNVPSNLTKKILDIIIPNPALQAYSENVQTRNYKNEGGFALRGGLKDVNMMISAGEEVGVPLPYANVIHDHITTALAHGYEDKDWAVLAEAARLAA